jgi:hypothetical protein
LRARALTAERRKSLEGDVAHASSSMVLAAQREQSERSSVGICNHTAECRFSSADFASMQAA